MNSYERLLLPENLNYAWQKAKRFYHTSDGYVDRGELAEFELDLERRLKRIQLQFESCHYQTQPLLPLPRPKKLEEGEPVNRQYYHVSVDDQVAWIAVANAVGPALDQMMPAWSYGNRLYRPAWYEDGENLQSKLEVGPYRHASGHLYRKFQHSWPLFRRHVALTARAMVRSFRRDELDTPDQLAFASAEAEGLPYLKSPFWRKPRTRRKTTDLYYASIDLKHFYPSIHTDAVFNGLAKAEADSKEHGSMHALLKSMLRFELDKLSLPEATMGQVDPPFGPGLRVDGIPTGLFVAGFLANAAMLPVDEKVNRRILDNRRAAHFRYVDDHTIIAYGFEALCDWIDWYKTLLVEKGIGPIVNEDKYDPGSLADWMLARSDARTTGQPSKPDTEEKGKHIALEDSKFDGANPTKLLTKTLAQVSAIATTNTDILDDEDLEERLTLLEWLLLADIPERELRPDTRAAFAAGQIAKLAPILVQETDGLIDEARALAQLQNQAPKLDRASPQSIRAYKAELLKKSKEVAALQAEYDKVEKRRLRHCFNLLRQAFIGHPSKARLFYRLLEYCRLTGHDGLGEIARWIDQTRQQGHVFWADYYCGLAHQILAEGLLRAVRAATNPAGLLSDRKAALRHIEDIAGIEYPVLSIPAEREAWFHFIGRSELAVSAMSAAEILREYSDCRKMAQRLRSLSASYAQISFTNSSSEWIAETGQPPGVWADHVESRLGIGATPSRAWQRFMSCLDYRERADRRAARLFPELLSDEGWSYFLQSKWALRESDSAWVREAFSGNEQRIAEARSSNKKAYRRAARSLDSAPGEWISVTEWTHFVKSECSAFDPRRSEWTALEVVRQVVEPAQELKAPNNLDRTHPNNVLIPAGWKTAFPADRQRAGTSWEEWRNVISNSERIRFVNRGQFILDYRYLAYTQGGPKIDWWECRLTAIGRLLLGLLRCDHDAPRLWNIRGNERVVPLPLTSILQSLAISSPTQLLVEGCLSGRSAETRAIARDPGLFGWGVGEKVNDARFDPPLLRNPNELLNAIKGAQAVLVENQLAVSMNQPRQLIPVRLSDFATGLTGEMEADVDDQ